MAVEVAGCEGRVLSLSILGTDDAARIFRRLEHLCAFGGLPALDRVFFCEISVGAAFGLLLEDGSRVVLKAHPAGRNVAFLEAARRNRRRYLPRHLVSPRRESCPEPGRVRLFLEEYEAGREKPFSAVERKAVVAGAVYAMAYAARRELVRAIARRVRGAGFIERDTDFVGSKPAARDLGVQRVVALDHRHYRPLTIVAASPVKRLGGSVILDANLVELGHLRHVRLGKRDTIIDLFRVDLG